jgi:hypothetical protein
MKEEFIQVLYTGRNHWVTVSTLGYGSDSSQVDIFDSLPPKVTDSLQNQIAALLCTKEQNITLQYKQYQQQNGSKDCGLYALAFAAMLASGNHPSAVHFNQSSMRKHLHCSLNNDNLFPFPISRSRRAIQQFTRHIINVPVYCYCRMPEIFSSRMIQCDNCSSWFHIGICVKARRRLKKKWICKNCSKT